ncbi:MAG: mechanosensitive ion channel family protein [Actinobacteria bacterium]|nr:mechanosensitive ion channel family protein [Actinomycetota bacterium]
MHFEDISRWARGNGLEILLIAIGSVLLARFAHWSSQRYQAVVYRKVISEVGEAGVVPEHSKRVRAVAQAAELGVTSLLYTVAALLVLSKFGLPFSSLVPPATILGVALGFGAQQIVADVLAGFFVLSERQFGVGDLVQLSQPGQTTGVRGTVEELTLRVTKLRTVQGEVVFVPNSALRQVTNLSREWSRVVVDVPVPVSQDLDKATEVVHQAAQEVWDDPQWHGVLLGEPVVAGVENIEVDHLQLRVIARTLPGKQFDVGRELRLRIALALQRAGIALPAPVTTSAGAG